MSSKHAEEMVIRVDDPRKMAVAFANGTEEPDPASKMGRKREKYFWLPRSQIEIDPPDAEPGDKVSVTMPQWLALEKGLI